MTPIPRYIERHAVDMPPWVELDEPRDELRICVVIPAYDELGNVEEVIEALDVDELSPAAVEVLVCVNNAEDSPPEAKEANRRTIEVLRALDTPFALHVIDRATEGRAYPAEDAGVGRARRLLMDTATRRLHRVGRGAEGLMACLDGDSPPDSGYLDAVWCEMSQAPPSALAGVCRHRHPLPDDPVHAEAIIAYENWMRYFESALHLTGTPYAFQSIGSCMVLTARGYAQADGVPPREALSDFYLLQKIVKTGGAGSVIQLREPMVRPSARPSTRVPRGTGPSVRASMHHGDDRFVWVEPPRAFFELRSLFAAVEPGFRDPQVLRDAASPFLFEVVDRWNGWKTIDKLREHAPDEARFERQFHTWFDSLKVVKFANRSQEKFGGVFVFQALRRLLDEAGYSALRGQIADVAPEEAMLDDWRNMLKVMRGAELDWW